MTLKIAFTVDDLAPTPGNGLFLKNGPIKYLDKLHDEFGCKFTHFAIPMMEGNEKYRWDKNEKWVEKIKSRKYFDIQQHGLFHEHKDKKYRSMEFYDVNPEEVQQRIFTGKKIFSKVDINVSGFKAPGWYLPKVGYKILSNGNYDYVADHFFGNKILQQNNIVRVPLTFSINKIYHDKYNDYLILHSHISTRDGNTNGWSEELYKTVKNYLNHLENKYDVEYITVSELVEEQKQ